MDDKERIKLNNVFVTKREKELDALFKNHNYVRVENPLELNAYLVSFLSSSARKHKCVTYQNLTTGRTFHFYYIVAISEMVLLNNIIIYRDFDESILFKKFDDFINLSDLRDLRLDDFGIPHTLQYPIGIDAKQIFKIFEILNNVHLERWNISRDYFKNQDQKGRNYIDALITPFLNDLNFQEQFDSNAYPDYLRLHEEIYVYTNDKSKIVIVYSHDRHGESMRFEIHKESNTDTFEGRKDIKKVISRFKQFMRQS